MLTTYMCAPGCHRGKEAEGRTGGPGCTSGWGCAGRCALRPRGWTYSPLAHKRKNCDDNIIRRRKEQTFICLQWARGQPVGEAASGRLRVRSVCQGLTGVDSTRVTIQLWQLSKQQEGQVMTRQTTPAWLTRYILSAGVNGFRVRVLVSSTASAERCLAVVQMVSLLPSSTCCSLVTLPLPLATRQNPHPPPP